MLGAEAAGAETGSGFGISTVGTGPSSMIKSKSITASLDFPGAAGATGAAGLDAGLTDDCAAALGAVCTTGFGEAAGFAAAVEATEETGFTA